MSKKQLYRRRTALLAISALILLFGSTLGESLAYFTTYTTTRGSCRLTFRPETEIEEEVKDLTKDIQITNTGDTDCFVRVRAFLGDSDLIRLTKEEEIVPKSDIAHWKKDGDWWYYDVPLKPKESTNVLKMVFAVTMDMMTDLEIDNFNVVIVHESTPVLYQANGDGTYTPYADWSKVEKAGME